MHNAESGNYLVSARYATLANGTALAITFDDKIPQECSDRSKGLALYDTQLPSTGGWDMWEDTEEVRDSATRVNDNTSATTKAQQCESEQHRTRSWHFSDDDRNKKQTKQK